MEGKTMGELDMPFVPSKRKQMQMLRDQGMKHREIAERFGVSRAYVAAVCGKCDPAYFVPVDDGCIYPNLRDWMNKNKVSRKEFMRRMGITGHTTNYERFTAYMRGDAQPRKPYIDKMLAVTGMTYEELFYTEVDDG
jgi:transcriptional regulator with XRE-family HTH domain